MREGLLGTLVAARHRQVADSCSILISRSSMVFDRYPGAINSIEECVGRGRERRGADDSVRMLRDALPGGVRTISG